MTPQRRAFKQALLDKLDAALTEGRPEHLANLYRETVSRLRDDLAKSNRRAHTRSGGEAETHICTA